MANYLPMDLVNDLFLRLPATTLVRYRVVSKPCFSLIDSPDFVASHLKRRLETGDHLMIFLRTPDGFLHTVYLDSPDKVTDIENPLQQSGVFTKVFGSCNGLIGLRNSQVDMALFNPSTRKTHRLPVEPVDFPLHTLLESVMYGFGYDSVSQDYKVLRMIHRKNQTWELGYSYEVKVFSLKRNSWMRVGMNNEIEMVFFRCYYNVKCRCQNGVLASNSLHWLLTRISRHEPRNIVFNRFNRIVRFDLASEEFGMLDLPNYLQFKTSDLDVGVFDGCLCLRDYTPFTCVNLWILKDYNAEGVWTKLFRVTNPEFVEAFKFVRPLLYSKDRSKILLEIKDGELVWVDLVSKSSETFAIKDCDDSFGAQVVVSSLVLGCNGDPHRARGMQTSNKRDDGFLSKGFKLKL